MKNKIIKSDYQGEIEISTFKIPCAVLEDGTRVLRERSVATSLGSKGSGAYWQKKKSAEKGAILPEYVSANYLQPFISDEVREKLLNPITYKQKSGSMAMGMNALLLPEICEIWLKADEKGAIPKSQAKAVKNAGILIRGLARIGIIALIDEATGYQEVRDRQALQKLLELYIAKELRPWVKTFPDEFYERLFKLKNWQYKPLSVKRPRIVGKITNDIIYDRLEIGVLKELQKIVPKDKTGRRKHHFHRRLTDDIGHPKLKEHISNVITLMRASSSYGNFYRLLQRALPKRGNTFELPFPDEEIK